MRITSKMNVGESAEPIEPVPKGDLPKMNPPDLVPQVYDELRKLAAVKLTGEQPGHTLDPTALVNEAWLKLAGDSFSTRSGFFRAAAMAMRRILVDHARARKAKKRGGDQVRTGLDLDHLASPDSHQDIEAIDAALEELAAVDPLAAELVQLRYFVGLSNADAAAALGTSPRTADRIWVYAKSWLYAKLSKDFLA